MVERRLLKTAIHWGALRATCCALIGAFTIGFSYGQSMRHLDSLPFTTAAERCIVPASTFHGVNHFVLRSILKIESGLNPTAFGKNENGTVDAGIGQMNSMHFRELAKHGITPEHLMDACTGTYVAAWHLGRIMAQHGNTWASLARYNSGTPYFNQRYQILLKNELIRSGVLDGQLMPVPPLKRGATTRGRTVSKQHSPVLAIEELDAQLALLPR